MPNSRHRSVMVSPSRRRATNRRRSSTTEHSFQGIATSRLPLSQAESVTHVSGTICHPCLGSLTKEVNPKSPERKKWLVHTVHTFAPQARVHVCTKRGWLRCCRPA